MFKWNPVYHHPAQKLVLYQQLASFYVASLPTFPLNVPEQEPECGLYHSFLFLNMILSHAYACLNNVSFILSLSSIKTGIFSDLLSLSQYSDSKIHRHCVRFWWLYIFFQLHLQALFFLNLHLCSVELI